MRIHVLCPPSRHFGIIRQCFEDIWEVVHEKEKQEWVYHGALQHTTVHWNGPRAFSTDVYSRDPIRKVCFNLTHDDITKTEGFHFCQKKSAADGVKGLGKIKVDNINWVTLVHHARHRFLEDQQMGETGPMGYVSAYTYFQGLFSAVSTIHYRKVVNKRNGKNNID